MRERNEKEMLENVRESFERENIEDITALEVIKALFSEIFLTRFLENVFEI